MKTKRRQPYRYVRRRWNALFSAIDRLGTMLFSAARAARGLVAQPQPAQEDDPKVVMLLQLDHLGDAVITTAMLPALCRRYPEASIEVLASPWNRDVFLAMPQVDRVHVCRINRFGRDWRSRFGWIAATFWWGLKLRSRHVDLAIDVRGEFPMAMMLWLCGAGRRLGWNCGGGGFFLTDSPEYRKNRPEVKSRADLLAELGIEAQNATPILPVDDDARRRMRDLLRKGKKKVAVLHIGAGTPAKKWQVSAWQGLIFKLTSYRGMKVVLAGGDDDCGIAEEIMADGSWPAVLNLTGMLTVDELAAVADLADVFVGADSGPAHVAAAVGTPTVVLFSGTNNSRQWRPVGRSVTVIEEAVPCSPCHGYRCKGGKHLCMERITAQSVFSAVERILEDAEKTPVDDSTDLHKEEVLT